MADIQNCLFIKYKDEYQKSKWTIECRIFISFIWFRSELWNRNNYNVFTKKRKLAWLDYNDYTLKYIIYRLMSLYFTVLQSTSKFKFFLYSGLQSFSYPWIQYNNVYNFAKNFHKYSLNTRLIWNLWVNRIQVDFRNEVKRNIYHQIHTTSYKWILIHDLQKCPCEDIGIPRDFQGFPGIPHLFSSQYSIENF